MRATDKYQTNRFKSADEMLDELNNVEFVSNVVGDSVFAGGDRPGRDPEEDEYEDDRRKSKKKKKKKRIWPAVLVVLLIVCGLGAGMLYATGFFSSFNKVVVPDVTGKTYDEARQILREAGLDIEEGDQVYSDTIETGLIAQQSPDANEKVEEGMIITVYISAGESTGEVPQLVGQYYGDDTSAYLKDSGGFTLGKVEYAKSDEYETGQIIRQNPKAGSVAEKGTAIDIVVCKGAKTVNVTVPSLTGLNIEEAKAKLRSNDLQVGAVQYEESTVYSAGTVMWQQYDAGTELKKNSTVNLKVSKGPPEEEVVDPTEPGDNDETDDDEDQQEEQDQNQDEPINNDQDQPKQETSEG